MDRWLAERGYDPFSLAQVPFSPVVPEDRDVMRGEFLQELRAVQKPERLAVSDAKHSGQNSFSGQKGGSESDPACFPISLTSHSVESEKRHQELESQTKSCKEGSSGKMNRGPTSCFVSPVGEPPPERTRHVVESHLVQSSQEKQPAEREALFSEPLGSNKNKEEDPPAKMNRGQVGVVVSTVDLKQKTNSRTATSSPELPGPARATTMPWKHVVPECRASPLLTPHMKTLLKRLPRECFLAPGGRRLKPDDDFWFERKGFLDLYTAVSPQLQRRWQNAWASGW